MMRVVLYYLIAIAVSAAAVAGVAWATRTPPAAPTDRAPLAMPWTDTPYQVAATPLGADGAAAPCVVCHSVEKGGPVRVAPGLWGIVGAPKARAGWYAYSPALAAAGGTWTVEALDEFLTDPDRMVPGTTKTLIGIPDDAERTALIAYLATLAD